LVIVNRHIVRPTTHVAAKNVLVAKVLRDEERRDEYDDDDGDDGWRGQRVRRGSAGATTVGRPGGVRRVKVVFDCTELPLSIPPEELPRYDYIPSAGYQGCPRT